MKKKNKSDSILNTYCDKEYYHSIRINVVDKFFYFFLFTGYLILMILFCFSVEIVVC